METYTIPQIVEQRICIANCTSKEFDFIKSKVDKTRKEDIDLEFIPASYLRIFIGDNNQGVYNMGVVSKNNLIIDTPFSNCERYDPSKFNF